MGSPTIATLVFTCCFLLPCFVAVPRRGSEWVGEDGLMLRLTGGQTVDEGIVEVLYNGSWGSVCDDLVTKDTADIICRMLGYPRARRCHCCGRLGRMPRDSPIWVDELDCRGQEENIFVCNRSAFGDHDCKHYEDVGVECDRPVARKREANIRLYCPVEATGSCNSCPVRREPRISTDASDCEDVVAVRGFVQVFLPEEDDWFFVSAEGWDDSDVRVACGQLGYPGEFGYPTAEDLLGCDPSVDSTCGGLQFQNNITMATMRNLDCTGFEHNLGQCLHYGWGVSTNPDKMAAGVACGYKEKHNGCSEEAQTHVRLRGGPVPSEGRVEVFRDNQWGSVEDATFFLPEGNVICRSLGYGTVKRYHHDSYFGFGIGPANVPKINCRGNESTHENCSLSRPESRSQHANDVGIECNRPLERCQEVARFHKDRDNFLEVNVGGLWGLVCFEMFNRSEVNVICRDLSSRFGEGVRRVSTSYNNGTRFVGRFECDGDELFLEECSMTFMSVDSCPGGEAVIDCGRALPDLVPDVRWLMDSFRWPYLQTRALSELVCELNESCLASDAQTLYDEGKFDSRRRLLTFNVLSNNRGMFDFRSYAPSNQWEFHECHDHYHAFDEFAIYDLRNLDGTLAAEGLKASYCLADSFCFAPRGSQRYRCQGLDDQGISVGCGDLYSSNTPCQWIDVTNVPLGNYRLEVTVNPKGRVPELDFSNNHVYCNITLERDRRVTSHGCALRGYE